jgi:hypothetical protein
MISRKILAARLCVLLAAFLWLFLTIADAQHQEAVNQERISEIERRVTDLEAMKIEQRITRVETIEDTNSALLKGIAIALALLILETAARTVISFRNKREQSG